MKVFVGKSSSLDRKIAHGQIKKIAKEKVKNEAIAFKLILSTYENIADLSYFSLKSFSILNCKTLSMIASQ